MKVQLLVDNQNSWMVPFAKAFTHELSEKGYDATYITTHDQITEGDILILLSCEKLLNRELRRLNQFNLVVHESAVPHGKGWSPLSWQVLEGRNKIPVSLLEADEKADSGDVYGRSEILFEGHELVTELREKQAKVTFQLLKDFLLKYPNVSHEPQSGEESFYRKRKKNDSELNPNLSLKDQFNLFRVVDNERYPAFFTLHGYKYILRIEKDNDNG